MDLECTLRQVQTCETITTTKTVNISITLDSGLPWGGAGLTQGSELDTGHKGRPMVENPVMGGADLWIGSQNIHTDLSPDSSTASCVARSVSLTI